MLLLLALSVASFRFSLCLFFLLISVARRKALSRPIYLFGWIPCTGFHCPLPIAISTPICSAQLIVSDSLFLLLVPVFKGLLELSCKKNRSSSQAVKGVLKENKTKGLEVC